MPDVRRILAAVDLGGLARPVLDVAASLGRRLGAPVTALHAYETRIVAPPDFSWLVPELEAERILHAATAGLAAVVAAAREAHPGAAIEPLVVEGPPAQEILRATWAERPDLVVQGTHGRGFWGRVVMGSVARRVIRDAPIPVLTVSGEAARVLVESSAPRLLVPTDFTPGSERALDLAIDLARRLGGRVRILSCFPDPQPVAILRDLHWALEAERAARARLEGLVASRREAGVALETETYCGPPARGILEQAERGGVTAVVMATHEKGVVERVLTGSVALDVARLAPVPVLTWWCAS